MTLITDTDTSRSLTPLAATLVAGLLLLTGLIGMLGWLSQGPEMIIALAQTGLSLCF